MVDSAYMLYAVRAVLLGASTTRTLLNSHLVISIGTRYWRNRVMKVANEFKKKVLNFAISSKAEFSSDLDSFNLKTDGDDPVAAIKSDDGSKYVMKKDFR